MSQLTLWYFFEEEDLYSSVTLSGDATIDQLRKMIYEQEKIHWEDIDAGQLKLLKVDIPANRDAIRSFQVPNGATKIHPMRLIREVWPHELVRHRLQICVRLPIEPPRKDDHERIFFAGPYGEEAPSTIAKFSEFYNVQRRSEERVANDRPGIDANHLPIALSYHGFGRFLDVTNGPLLDDIPEIDIKWRELEVKVDKFINSMNLYYDNEMARNEMALECLNDIFACYTGDQRPLVRAVVNNKCTSDGHALGLLNTIEVVLELKNELVGTGTDPTIEICGYYTQSLLEKYPTSKFIPRFLFPALGIVIIGSHIGFYALAFEQRTRLVALTPLLPTTTESGNDWVRPTLLKAFKAAFVLRHHISEDTKKFSTSQTPTLPIKKHLPYVNRIARYPPDTGASPREFSFHIYQEALFREADCHPFLYLYLATLDKPDDGEDDQLVVKFTQQYCPELHLFCSERRRAPKLLGYGMIPGGWYVVVMEKVLQPERGEPFGRARFQTWSRDLKSLVKDFHDEGWVHGDLRVANLMFDRKNLEHIMLIDFDWGGKVDEGPVYYPTALLNEELEKPGDQDDLRITKERDDHVLALTLNYLEKLITEGL